MRSAVLIGNSFALTVCVLSAPALGQLSRVYTYEPPGEVICFSYDGKELHAQITGKVWTPIGTFGMGSTLGSSFYPDPHNTYFFIRGEGSSGDQNIYCLGTRGSFTVSGQGPYRYRFSPYQDWTNVTQIVAESPTGPFNVEFVPDKTKPELARIRHDPDLVLSKDGKLTFDRWWGDTEIAKDDIKKVVFADAPEKHRMGVSVECVVDGTRKLEVMVCDGQERIEALWMRRCLQSIDPSKVTDTEATDSFGKNLLVFGDGSVIFRYGINSVYTTDWSLTFVPAYTFSHIQSYPRGWVDRAGLAINYENATGARAYDSAEESGDLAKFAEAANKRREKRDVFSYILPPSP